MPGSRRICFGQRSYSPCWCLGRAEFRSSLCWPDGCAEQKAQAFGASDGGEYRSPLGLLGLDDRAPDRPGLGEQVLELLALAPADRALQGGQVLGEAAEHLQHRFAI